MFLGVPTKGLSNFKGFPSKKMRSKQYSNFFRLGQAFNLLQSVMALIIDSDLMKWLFVLSLGLLSPQWASSTEGEHRGKASTLSQCFLDSVAILKKSGAETVKFLSENNPLPSLANPEWWQTRFLDLVSDFHLREYLAVLNQTYGISYIEKTYGMPAGEKFRELLWFSRERPRGSGFGNRQGFFGIGEGFFLPDDTEFYGLISVSDEFRIEVATVSSTGFLKKRLLKIEEALDATPAEPGSFERHLRSVQESHKEQIRKSEREAQQRFQPRFEVGFVTPSSSSVSEPQNRPERSTPNLRRERNRKKLPEPKKTEETTESIDEAEVLKFENILTVSELKAQEFYQTPGPYLSGVRFHKKVVDEFNSDAFLASTFESFQKVLLRFSDHKTQGSLERLFSNTQVYVVRISGRARGNYRLLGCLEDGVFIAILLADHRNMDHRAKQIECPK